MNSGRIAIVGLVILGLFVARYVLLATHHPTPTTAKTPAFQDAATQAANEHKLLVVDAMASWCGPCKMMERDSWSNPEVESWMKDNAVFAQIDVDEQQETAQDLKIEAMPTVILFKDGHEIRRSVGYLNANDLLTWLKTG